MSCQTNVMGYGGERKCGHAVYNSEACKFHYLLSHELTLRNKYRKKGRANLESVQYNDLINHLVLALKA